MKNGVRILLIIAAFTVLLSAGKNASAQCSMCTTTVESNNASGANATKGINNGILFLLAAPYLAAGVGAYVWYKKYRRKSVDINMRDEKLHLN